MVGINDVGVASLAYEQGTCGGPDNQDCIRNTASAFREHFTTILSRLRSINGDRNAVILVADIYNPGVQAQADVGTIDVYLPLFNQINSDIHSISAANGISVANVYEAFNGADGLEDPIARGYIAVDDVHASAEGHAVIAAQFRSFSSVLLDADTDRDGFSNLAENYYGADLLASCPESRLHTAWPPDQNNDGVVSVVDVLSILGRFRSPNHRFDLNMDGTVAAVDILYELAYYGKSCPS
jgi:hypothetical protein